MDKISMDSESLVIELEKKLAEGQKTNLIEIQADKHTFLLRFSEKLLKVLRVQEVIDFILTMQSE